MSQHSATLAKAIEYELEVRHLSKSFGGLEVLRDISFNLQKGDVLGVIGPNGAGKTTLINMVCGRVTPSSGRIFLRAEDVTAKPSYVLSHLGLTRSFQQANIFASATVSENISRSIKFGTGLRGRKSSIEGLLKNFGLFDRQDEISGSLPYGLQKLLGLIMSYATNASVILLDEPAAGLERSERDRIDYFVNLAKAGEDCALVIVEHDMDLIKRLCPRILVVEGGKVLAEGAPDVVLSREDVIAAYLGAATDEAV